ncbi:hypothetical protein SSX86_001814 [Deinandra increscens subsp. villosa]|uniref:TIR domain-containing protein n=1 Tax=Deinandra increscens subsp. villosa TaxID=3103831 RepID=A0AAP0DZR0_9ASTR
MMTSSSTTVPHAYDVFMSFRGDDTRTGFTSHLYDALTRNDITTYKDDKKLELGKPVASELLEAIETSRTAIVVLSSRFATSNWCLEEIAKIADCMKRGKLTVIPVFYHVSPSDVRHQSNCFEQGFAKHEVNPEIAPQKVDTWRAAFREVGAISGLHVTQYRDEAEVVSEIVSKIRRDLPDTTPIDLPNSLVGIKSRVDEVKKLLRMGSSEVLFVGICGMSGIGKTTLAEAVYINIQKKFERSSLIENIKDISKQNDSTDLCKLQQKLLDDILIEKSIRVQSVIHGQTLLGTKLRGLKVIIVLDDVNHADQLAYLAGGLEWFGPGTRIIVTTTNRDLLNAHKINEIYLCEEMKDDEALTLFCRSAFEQSHPTYGYEKLSNDIVKLAGGLPLALNVYGKLLCGKDGTYWKEMLKKLGEYPEKEVLGRLEVVFARLDKNQRHIFIYIACFLKGRNKDLVKDILTDIGLYPECGMTDLMNKFLITIDLEDCVWMHDLLQQMCWEIICKESHRYVGKYISIKYHEDIVDILSSKSKGMNTVEVINQEPYKGKVNDHFSDPMCFSEMKKLKFLRISNVHFPQGLNYLSNELRILEWYGCSLNSLPSMFEPKHIYELEICSSQLKTLWKIDLELSKLRSVDLSFSKDLTDIPNLTSALNLVKLNLEGCTTLTSLHESVLLQKRLRYLNLKGCTCLESLGRSRMEMDALEALLLSGCSKLQNIPEFGKNMKRLEHLYVDGTRIKKLPENLGEMCDLRKLDASQTLIKELPFSIYLLKERRLLHVNSCLLSFKTVCFLNPRLRTVSSRLKEVDLSYCNLFVVPDGIGLLCHLITLDLSGNEFVLLPASIGLLSKLRVLCLNNCKRLQSLPKLSLVDDDMDYGPRSRFNYYTSAEEVDVSKFHASSYNNSPTVSCLNCPKLAADKCGSSQAEKILNTYLKLRTKYWMTPEAVFEIFGAGSKIPDGSVEPGTGGLILEGQCIGVAIYVVMSIHHIDAYMEAKNMVTAHIIIGERHWKISVPVHFLVAGSETQLVFYCPVTDDLQSQESNLGVSFSVEPEDINLHVIKVGLRFINKGYIMSLKQHNDSRIWVGKGVCGYIAIHESYDVANLHDHICKLLDFIFHYGRQQDSLDAIYQITKGLHTINHEFFRPLGAWTMYFYGRYICCYYVISLGASVLYNDFVESLKDINAAWLSVKWALEHFVVKRGANGYSYREMLQHLSDLEAANNVEFSDNFVRMFLSVCRRTLDILHSKFRSKKYCFTEDGWFTWPQLGNMEWKISDFYENEILLQGLVHKMAQTSSFTKENEQEMLSVINKLQKNIAKMMPSSSTTISHGYDVFISFRGDDTRAGFTSHLYDALTRNGITTHKDDKTLEIGKPMASELLEAIETSRTAIVVLSCSFATSKWCLEEIAKIVDCMRRGKLIVVPVFYHVSPSDVRHQSNCFEQGFAKHEVNPEIAPQKLETWRAAFKEVGAISGLHVTQYRDEAEVVSKIVSKILSDTTPVDVPSRLVGIESRVEEVKTLLRMESPEVLFIGICGMSGIGKTTLAEAVYKDIKNKFDKSSLIENIKDISKQNDSKDLCKLQQKLLDDILMEKSIRVQSVIHGQTLLGAKLRGLKVIIVLDDVNHADQLAYLAGGLDWFGPGTRIIVTTTNRDLLNAHKINEIYLCEEMKDDEALSLFSQSAFKQSHPTHAYEKLSNDIVKLAGGLPLALNVYGKLLCGKDENYWKEMLQKLGEYPEKEVLGRLEVVYARLDDNQRYAFIYIACFLKGRNKDLVKDILTDTGLYSECGIADLLNKCLITINLEDNVWMHDLLQQMCWKILHTESYKYDGNHIAIKSHEDIVDVLSTNPKGTQNVEVINQDPYKLGEVSGRFIDPMCFSKMTKLKFLRISNVHFPKGLKYLSNDLRILEWHGCSLKSLPSTFEPKHIYELEMCSSQLKTLWKKDLDLPNLDSINLSFSKGLTKIPDLTSASNLVKLNLEGCTSLTRLHASVLLQKRLRYLNLRGCTHLQSLGRSRMEMEALEALLLSGCSKLKYIPEFGKNMNRLEHLYVDGTRIKKLPENLGEMCDLRNLDVSQTFIEELPSSIYRLKKLRLLHANSCLLSFKRGCFLKPRLHTISSSLKEVELSDCNLCVVPDGIGLLYHLITLDLSGNEFVSLPASIGLLSKLRVLCLNNCKRLQSLPKLSLVDEDMDYGPRSRFTYYVSAEEVDVSKFHASSYNNRPTVSCLNCPKLAADKCGSYLAEKILNSYLDLRTKYWMTPEAVFEIVGAGSEIPDGFVQPGNGGLILEGPWIGVAICAVISVHNFDAYMEVKYMVTAHINLGEKHWKIPIPIHFLVAESETQLVLYWTVADDLQRIVGSSQKSNFRVSFSVEPEGQSHDNDVFVPVAKFGIRFIRKEYMLRHQESYMIGVGRGMIRFANLDLENYKLRLEACKDYTYMDNHIQKIVNLTFDPGRQQGSLDGINQITKGLLKINPEYFRYLDNYRSNIYSYYVISLGASTLYTDFVRSVKDLNDGWRSVKLALEQIVVKSRADSYSYKEMLLQLNDLEVAKSVVFSDKFIKMLESVFTRTFDIMDCLNIALHVEYLFSPEKSYFVPKEKVMAKTLIFITGILCTMAAYTGDLKLLTAMKQTNLSSMLLHLIRPFIDKEDKKDVEFIKKTRSNRELQISDFDENGILVQELMNKMARSSCFTIEIEEEMASVIVELQKNIHKVSSTIRDISSHAHQYSHDLRRAKKHVKCFSQLSHDDDILSMLSLFNKS